VDTNATAQFFVNSNGMWVTISGDGAGGTVTNVHSATLLAGTTYPTVTQYSAFYHVSVLHDYASSNWSLFVNDAPIATNLNFIASGVSTHQWFQVQNMGGNVSNVCWLDDFLITNRMATSGSGNTLTNVVPGTTIPVADALAGFGAVTDPRPTNEAVGASSSGVSLDFGRIFPANRKYVVLGGANLSGLTSNGVLNGAGVYVDSTSLASGTRAYYKIVTESEDGSVSVTNDETYAAYRQPRAKNRTYYVGAPIDTTDGNRTLSGSFGTQLKSGLATGDVVYIYNGVASSPQTLNPTTNWSGDSLNVNIPAGQGLRIERRSGGAATSSTYLVGTVPTNAAPVTIVPGFNIVSWPYGSTGSLNSFSNLIAATATSIQDYIRLQNNTDNITLAHYTAGGWKSGFLLGGGGTQVLNPTLEPGAGILIYHVPGGDAQWKP